MPAKKRRIDPGLIERLRTRPQRFEFFQAVRLLALHYRRHAQVAEHDVLGQLIRFRSSISLAFPPSEIEAIEFRRDDAGTAQGGMPAGLSPVTLTPSFIGLTGPLGVLPRHYTQHVAEREIHQRDTAVRAFLDIFSNRAVTLFYRSWLRSRLHLQYEAGRMRGFLPQILSLAGLGLPGLNDRLVGEGGITDESLAFYAGALCERPRSALRFAQVVGEYFGVRCKVEQFVGQWLQLPEPECTRLGLENCTLGASALCGARVWDRQGKIRLQLGPMRKKQFNAFLPGGAAAAGLRRLFRLMAGTTIDCEVRLVLDRRDLASAVLGGVGDRTHLGWNGWLASRGSGADSHDVCYLINAWPG
ncbi:MAG TPA: type VI secretion system baseplate subunit TssG [Noviherbaspirillum sp.]|nr:type VI secretion system baseplate subunit TssG [Noviherbaspirillum sp.]